MLEDSVFTGLDDIFLLIYKIEIFHEQVSSPNFLFSVMFFLHWLPLPP